MNEQVKDYIDKYPSEIYTEGNVANLLKTRYTR